VQLERAVDAYLRHVSIERGLSDHTVAAYRRDLAGYVDWLAEHGIRDSAEVTTALVAEFAAERASGDPPPASSSLARLQSSVRGLHRYLAREGIEAADPTGRLRPPKAARRLPKALTIEQVERLLDAAGPTTAAAGGAEELIGLRDRALLELLYATGARVSEVVQLDVDDLAQGEVVRVRGKGSKERIIPVGSYARAALEAYLTRSRPELSRRGRATPRLFLGARGAPLSRQSAWLVIQHAAERAQLTAHVSPHTLRHSFATHLLQGGADVRVVQELLGHASVATTQIYTHVSVDALRDVYSTSHPRAR
jgi:integrase/recombinase XerD